MTSEEIGGYDYNFIESPPDDFVCLICHLVARDPQQLLCCGKLCCNSCLKESRKHTDDCPQCRKRVSSYQDIRGDRAIKRLKVECSNRSKGCQFVGELGQHDATCDFSLLPCPNKCTDQQNKITTVMKKDMEKHTMECPKRQYECPHCKETGEYNERTTKHLEECPKMEDVCPNEGCTEKSLRCDLPKHRQECPHELVMCKYAYLGCDVTLPREEMTEHQKDDQSHANLSMLKHRYRYYCVDDFDERKRDDPQVRFNFHFREEDGDKEEIVTTLITFLSNENISFRIFSMSYSLFPWKPITIELLNQLEDNHHHCCRLRLLEEGDKNSKFIAHSVLGYNPTINCQYLKDDKLYFRVSLSL